nr:S-adenosyl-L-methionine-dependent methyltransferases superfamily protein [Tanacetum cinerariifolium]
NKAKPEGSIAEGYVAEEALTFSSHYFRDVTMKFNRPGRNVDPPPPTFDDVRYVVHSRDERRITQNSGICSPGPDEEMYYGQLQEILEFNLNDLDNATLHIDGQSTEVDAPSDIIDVVDEDGDIIDDEDALPHDLAYSDDEDLINMSTDVARSHGGDGGGEDRPPTTLCTQRLRGL